MTQPRKVHELPAPGTRWYKRGHEDRRVKTATPYVVQFMTKKGTFNATAEEWMRWAQGSALISQSRPSQEVTNGTL